MTQHRKKQLKAQQARLALLDRMPPNKSLLIPTERPSMTKHLPTQSLLRQKQTQHRLPKRLSLQRKKHCQSKTPVKSSSTTHPNHQQMPQHRRHHRLPRHPALEPAWPERVAPRLSPRQPPLPPRSTRGPASRAEQGQRRLCYLRPRVTRQLQGSKEEQGAPRCCHVALDMVKAAAAYTATPQSAELEQPVLDPRVVFEPLRLACRMRSNNLTITSLDCISKLVSYAFFAEDDPTAAASAIIAAGQPPQTLADLVTETICDCYQENLDDKVALQIIKALLASVLSTTVHVHQSSLLKAVRTVYNIFLMSKLPTNQAIAQGSLTQMVHHVFARVPRSAVPGSGRVSASHSTSDVSQLRSNGTNASHKDDESHVEAADTNGHDDADGNDRQGEAAGKVEKVTLQTLEERKSFEGASERDNAGSLANMSTAELFVKDAFLVLRALCKLTMKPLGAESERDLKSHAMRSKLLSLHLILTILQSHMTIFTDPSVIIHSTTTGEQTQFVQAVKQYLCLSLSRNAVSSINQVFEISCEIFWHILDGMRTKLKKEIEVLLNEIFCPFSRCARQQQGKSRSCSVY